MLSLFAAAALVPLPLQETPTGRVIVTREDLAEVVQEVDAALAAGKLLPPKAGRSALAETNLAFDAVTLTFFGMDLTKALGELEDLRDGLIEEPRGHQYLTVDTDVDGVWVKHAAPLVGQAGEVVRYRLRARQAVLERKSTAMDWLVKDGNSDHILARADWGKPFRLESAFDHSGRLVPVEFQFDGRPAEYPASIVLPASPANLAAQAGQRHHVPIQGAALRADLQSRLAQLDAALHSDAIRVFRQRLELRWEAPSQENSTEFSLDPVAFEAELRGEIEQLEAGKNPYLGRPGDHWRTFAHGRRNLPARVYGQPISADEPLPLVIAFHGAGGDENFMFELAGDGYLKRLAEERRAVVVCPRTADYMFSAGPFQSLLKGIQASYSIDSERVFVLGHSMGGMATSGLCHKAPELITQACCIAGFSDYAYDPALPIQVISGRLDRIVSFARVEGAARSAKEKGGSIQFTPLDDQGHTLLLPAALDLAFEQFFEPSFGGPR